ncbi:MAG: carbohydrate ABC transporter permease [Clostridia bacterium]|nr:carbohydrate ABC transporter permease [Clostridia bacterium]
MSKKLNRSTGVTIAVYVGLIFFMLFMMIPFYVIIANTITGASEMQASEHFIALPSEVNITTILELLTGTNLLENEESIWNGASMLVVGYWNMFWQGIPRTIVSLVASGLAGYAYCKLQFKGKNGLFAFQISLMMIPGACLSIPTYLYYDALGWVGTVLPLIIPGLFGGAATIFFMKQFFESIPTEIIEAARIDGLDEISIFFKIILPLAMPAFITQFILAFVGCYNSYMGPLLYIPQHMHLHPIQMVIQNDLITSFGSASFEAAKVLGSIIPICIVYLFGQKFIISGITSGAVKG